MTFRSCLAALLLCLPLAAQAEANRPLPLKKPVAPPAGAVGLCAAHPFACAGGSGAPVGAADLALAQAVNRDANARIAPLTDAAQWGRPEVWSLPTPAGGDCEDYVLWKKRALIAAGIAPARLLIATVMGPDRVSHAVLVLRAEGGDYVLDNLTDDVLRWDRTGYAFLRVQDPEAPTRWRVSFAGGFLG